MTSISSFMPPASERAPAQNPSETANQRDSWLRQMELAQVASMNEAGAHAAVSPSARPAAQRLQSVLTPAARPAPQTMDGPAQLQCHGMAQALREGQARAGTPAIARDRMLSEVTACLSVAASAVSPPAAGAERQLEQTTATTAAALTRQLRLAFGSAPQIQTAGGSEEAPVHGETAAGEAPQWEERKIHFSGQGQDVDVWIRDSALTESASTPLLAQLAQEMAGMGLRMKNVTINGKAVHTEREAPPAQAEHRINHPEKTYGTR